MLIKSVVYLHDTKKPTSKTESITDTKKKKDRKIIKKKITLSEEDKLSVVDKLKYRV